MKYFENLKTTKMILDLFNVIPISAEDHCFFMDRKDANFKQVVEYKLNDENRIGDNFVYNPDILALGCSVTVPIGIPHGLSWPHLIKDEINESLNVMADGGSSVQRITYNATHHMLKYGIPKKVYFLIPSLDRAWIPIKNNPKNYPRPNSDDLTNEDYYQLQNQVWRYDTNEYESGRGHFVSKDFLNIKRSISLEYGLQNQILSLVSFFSFCKLLGIDCFYYSWDAYFDNIFSRTSLLDGLANYVKYEDNNHSCWWQTEHIDFDPSYFSNNEEHQKYWEKGLDKPEWAAHPGMYTHIRMAERFLGRKLSQKTIDNAKC